MDKIIRRSAAGHTSPPADSRPAESSMAIEPVVKDLGLALQSLYAPIAERALPIYYGPVLGRLFLKGRL